MSLLQQDSPELDDAARGEEFTKGSSHVVLAGIVAAVLVTAGIAIYVIAGQKPPVAAGEIVQVWAHPQHTETPGFDANGAPMPKETFDQVFVFAQIRLRNQSNQPLFLTNILTNATLAADKIDSAYATTAGDYDRVFLAYPNLDVPHGKALRTDATIEPGQTVEGTVVSAFKLTKQEWDARKDLNFTIAFQYQPSMVLAPRSAVIDR
jgi:hypothetical protein